MGFPTGRLVEICLQPSGRDDGPGPGGNPGGDEVVTPSLGKKHGRCMGMPLFIWVLYGFEWLSVGFSGL